MVNSPLLSRSLLFRLEPLTPQQVRTVLERALADPERGLGGSELTFDEAALDHVVDIFPE